MYLPDAAKYNRIRSAESFSHNISGLRATACARGPDLTTGWFTMSPAISSRLPLSAAALVLFVTLGMAGVTGDARAETKSGDFCKVATLRVSNGEKEILREKLWEYAEAKASDGPLLGWVDVACADRGPSRSELQDFGNRVWFNVSGPENGTPDQMKITFGQSQLMSKVGDVGISAKGLSIIGLVSPRHDCAFTVAVWREKCASTDTRMADR